MFQNFWEIISQFLEKIPINARFFTVSSQLVYCSHFLILFQYFTKTVFKHFSNFTELLHYFFTLAVSRKLISHFLTIFLKKVFVFSIVASKHQSSALITYDLHDFLYVRAYTSNILIKQLYSAHKNQSANFSLGR